MKKLSFIFNIVLLVLTFTFVSCGKRCLDPNANNSTEKGDCVYPADEYKGVYAMTCNCSPTTGTGGSNITKTFDLEIVKIGNSDVAVKNLQGCGGSVSINLFVDTYHSGLPSFNVTCDGINYTIHGSIDVIPASGDISASYNMIPSGTGLTWYNCTATGKRK